MSSAPLDRGPTANNQRALQLERPAAPRSSPSRHCRDTPTPLCDAHQQVMVPRAPSPAFLATSWWGLQHLSATTAPGSPPLDFSVAHTTALVSSQISHLYFLTRRADGTLYSNPSLYLYSSRPSSAPAAAQACIEWSPDALLTSVLSSVEESRVYGFNATSLDPKWIGLTANRSSPSIFAWSDGSSYSYHNFISGHPDYANGNVSCVSMGVPGGQNADSWIDLNCTSNQLSFVCKRKITGLMDPCRNPTLKALQLHATHLPARRSSTRCEQQRQRARWCAEQSRHVQRHNTST